MYSSFVFSCAILAIAVYGVLYSIIHLTQSKKEPTSLSTALPFIDPAIGIQRKRVNYLVDLRAKYALPIFTVRMPFQRLYVVTGAEIIRIVQLKKNMTTFVANLLDFGLLFSGVNKKSRELIGEKFSRQGNAFTISVHKYLAQGPTLQLATRAAVEKLAASIRSNFSRVGSSEVQLLETIRHDLMLALTGAIYGPENPYDDPAIESSWQDFVPGISHLLYSPFPFLTARKALRARSRIHSAFADYFATGGYNQAFPMIAEMFDANRNIGLSLTESAKLEMATSLAMLSSGAITTFWLIYHICSDASILAQCRAEVLALATCTGDSTSEDLTNMVDMSLIKTQCPTIAAMLHETLRYHSTLINIKKVNHDTTLEDYLLKKDAIVMIPGKVIHHDPTIWGPSSTTFDHHRFMDSDGQKKLGNTLAYRPFGAGTSMCPGRHFSTNVMLSFVAMVLLQFDIEPADGEWRMPGTTTADMWNAMPKPDHDVPVKITPREDMEAVSWKFVWDGTSASEDEDADKEGA